MISSKKPSGPFLLGEVICLCGWSRRWVQAGNVFSCTTLAILWLQYLARCLVTIGLLPLWKMTISWIINANIQHFFVALIHIMNMRSVPNSTW